MQSPRRRLSSGCLALVAALSAVTLAPQAALASSIGADRSLPGMSAIAAAPLQEVVTGTVVSARTGQPLAGAQVVVDETGQGVSTIRRAGSSSPTSPAPPSRCG